jgi:hypothetical protein
MLGEALHDIARLPLLGSPGKKTLSNNIADLKLGGGLQLNLTLAVILHNLAPVTYLDNGCS